MTRNSFSFVQQRMRLIFKHNYKNENSFVAVSHYTIYALERDINNPINFSNFMNGSSPECTQSDHIKTIKYFMIFRNFNSLPIALYALKLK